MREPDARQLLSFPPNGDLTAAVRQVIRGTRQDGWITIDRVASLACMSVRTLQRRLADEATFFAALVDEVRAELAAHMLKNTEASLDEIARAVGYSATTNFIRAFRRWTGKTPAEFRQ
jgi:AraC-like DNA-binding protein